MIAFNKNKVEKVGSRNSQILVKCFRCYNSEEILLKANKVDPSDIVKKYEDINYYRICMIVCLLIKMKIQISHLNNGVKEIIRNFLGCQLITMNNYY